PHLLFPAVVGIFVFLSGGNGLLLVWRWHAFFAWHDVVPKPARFVGVLVVTSLAAVGISALGPGAALRDQSIAIVGLLAGFAITRLQAAACAWQIALAAPGWHGGGPGAMG